MSEFEYLFKGKNQPVQESTTQCHEPAGFDPFGSGFDAKGTRSFPPPPLFGRNNANGEQAKGEENQSEEGGLAVLLDGNKGLLPPPPENEFEDISSFEYALKIALGQKKGLPKNINRDWNKRFEISPPMRPPIHLDNGFLDFDYTPEMHQKELANGKEIHPRYRPSKEPTEMDFFRRTFWAQMNTAFKVTQDYPEKMGDEIDKMSPQVHSYPDAPLMFDAQAFFSWFKSAQPSYITQRHEHFLTGNGETQAIDVDHFLAKNNEFAKGVDLFLEEMMGEGEKLCPSGSSVPISSRAFESSTKGSTMEEGSDEEWAKTVGKYWYWGHANVSCQPGEDGAPDTYTMECTIHMEDRYNYNPKEKDIATKIPDFQNGVLALAGLANQFNHQGTIHRKIQWKKGDYIDDAVVWKTPPEKPFEYDMPKPKTFQEAVKEFDALPDEQKALYRPTDLAPYPSVPEDKLPSFAKKMLGERTLAIPRNFNDGLDEKIQAWETKQQDQLMQKGEEK